MEGNEDHVDQLDPDKRCDHAAQSPDQQVAAEQGVGADGTVLHSLERDRNQQRNDRSR